MGWFNILVGNADGIRETIFLIYKKQFNIYREAGNENPHELGLISALGIRYLAARNPQTEAFLYREIAPFFAMESHQQAVDALAEYIVFKERPNSCEYLWLKQKINDAVLKEPGAGVWGLHGNFEWSVLLYASTNASIVNYMLVTANKND